MPRRRKQQSTEIARELGLRLAQARMGTSLSQTKIAAAIGMPQATFAYVETGALPMRVRLVVDVARHLQVDPAKMLDLATVPAPRPNDPLGDVTIEMLIAVGHATGIPAARLLEAALANAN